jgi:hypothetical protein
MIEKTCFKCLITKPLGDFYKHPEMADGYLGKCKECAKKDSTSRRNEKVDEVRAYDRKRGSLPHRLQQVREYKKTPRGRELVRKHNAEYDERYPEKKKAHEILNNAVRDGKVIKLPCCVCGSENSQGHHEDYSKPLDVIWFCPTHHGEHHKKKDQNAPEESAA